MLFFTKKNCLKLTGFFFIGLFMTSCDKEHTKEYFIKNELVENITVNFKIDGSIDSLTLSPNENKLVYTDVYYFGTVGVSDERFTDRISDITIQSKTNNKDIDESLWIFEAVNKYFATYTIIVN